MKMISRISEEEERIRLVVEGLVSADENQGGKKKRISIEDRLRFAVLQSTDECIILQEDRIDTDYQNSDKELMCDAFNDSGVCCTTEVFKSLHENFKEPIDEYDLTSDKCKELIQEQKTKLRGIMAGTTGVGTDPIWHSSMRIRIMRMMMK